jgi:hypothetical protein
MKAGTPIKKWDKEEENYIYELLKTHKIVANLPLISMSQKLNRTPDSIRRKAVRLQEAQKSNYQWDKEEREEAFRLYLKELPSAKILEKLHEQGSTASMKNLEDELKRLREVLSQRIRKYAEERQLPVAKHFRLDTIKFFMDNQATTSDFTRKALHSRIKNG